MKREGVTAVIREIKSDSYFKKVVSLAIEKKQIIKTMESCTGGAIASAITNIEGASYILKESYITYSNESKIDHGVDAEVINKYSVYSEETALAMASACLIRGLKADIGIGVTGNFGNIDPYNKTASIPGKVYFAIVGHERQISHHLILDVYKSRQELKEIICKQVGIYLLDYLKEIK